MASPQSSPRELSNSIIGALLAHVGRVGGDESVLRLLQEAGESRAPSELEDPNNWSSYEETRRLFASAATLLTDPELGRSVGEGLLSRYSSSGVLELLRSMEGPGEVLRLISEVATKQSTVTTMECVEVDERHGVVVAQTKAHIKRDRLFCDYTAGVLSGVPTIFGMAPATVLETECQTRGDRRCLYQVSWDPNTATDLAAQVHFLRAQMTALTTRFEALEQMASELASVADVDEALQLIIERAGVAIRAPQFLLAVRLPRESLLRIHHVGLRADEVARVADEVLADPPDDHDGARLIVDVISSAHSYGRIAALYPESYRFLREERKLFLAYAGHAAAALDTAAALGEARERAETLGALFDLATALSEVATVQAVAERLAQTLLNVADCREAAVFVFEPKDAMFVCEGRANSDPQKWTRGRPGTFERIGIDHLLLDSMTSNPAPILFSGLDGSTGVAEISKVAGFEAGVIVPVVARGRLLAMLAVEVDDSTLEATMHSTGRSRLDGIASIAATAFDNAGLLDEIRHQAGHDPLTDLPNSRLFEELVNKALANAEREGSSVGYLFIDLDHFKRVNDELGHHAGDVVLVEAGVRLQAALRSGDTVGRLGGDEFVVLMPRVTRTDLETVAGRILENLERPISVLGATVQITGSIGVALAQSTDSVDSLRRRADNAMYQAKSDGRARCCFSA